MVDDLPSNTILWLRKPPVYEGVSCWNDAGRGAAVFSNLVVSESVVTRADSYIPKNLDRGSVATSHHTKILEVCEVLEVRLDVVCVGTDFVTDCSPKYCILSIECACQITCIRSSTGYNEHPLASCMVNSLHIFERGDASGWHSTRSAHWALMSSLNHASSRHAHWSVRVAVLHVSRWSTGDGSCLWRWGAWTCHAGQKSDEEENSDALSVSYGLHVDWRV